MSDHLARWAAIRRLERPTRERPLYIDIEQANRRDAAAAAEFASPSQDTTPRPNWAEPTKEPS